MNDVFVTRPTIVKNPTSFRCRPNLVDYAAARVVFDWGKARLFLDGLPGGRGLNIAHEAVDRHANGPRADRVALRWIGKSGDRRDITYRALAAETSRFANALGALGIGQGGRVFLLLGRVPELYVAMLGALKAKCVVTPLFSAFGPEPIATRLEIGDGQVLVTTEALYRRKVEALRSRLPKLAHVILVDDGPPVAGTLRWRELMAAADDRFTIPPTDPEDMALVHFTSGTTGRPKGAIHVHDAVVAHYVTGSLCARPARRRHLLVHRRSGLGHRHQLRDHRAADARRDQSGRRSRVRCAELVRRAGEPSGSASGTPRRPRSA